MKPTIVINPFVRRQTLESEFSYYHGSEEDLLELVGANFADAKVGYREGVLEVPVPAEGFYSALVTLNEGDKLVGEFKARRPGETPRKSIRVAGASKQQAKAAAIILYASTVLSGDGDNSIEAVDGNWEVISINANPVEGEMPINPMVLMHNHFGSDGGTDTNLSDADFVALLKKGFLFFRNKAMAGG